MNDPIERARAYGEALLAAWLHTPEMTVREIRGILSHHRIDPGLDADDAPGCNQPPTDRRWHDRNRKDHGGTRTATALLYGVIALALLLMGLLVVVTCGGAMPHGPDRPTVVYTTGGTR